MEMNLSPDELESLANRFKILGEPARLQILSSICGGERNVQEICDRTGLNQANVSKHLRLLKDAKIVACKRVGVCRYYRVIDPDLLGLCVSARHLLQDRKILAHS
ncbi:winged helix-turn-helix transcriptional regulator [Oxynema sp. CENA135]|jgi:DNA-binding transcriptional ArsR family regulator|uniref:Winged helix-turn-helix transcriptional regulator n=2 Tax=Oxynema TaxID=1492710 RepID=A0A6H1TWT9_9CYAN|nr:metalloregulator ArsR/SmtB family transcription factor [Oxynema aestuarii]MBK4731705.1 winged helix-turn-helix transcriptional regulator [Oxynema sp. CENA135]QIZ70676.1 winged helix-turn-helix transcriptional regulator [Oxynema aestuarii AP17]RMH77009.1 MAG: ArsR family transcriptional regulator [Cyanobacteria bacterium J007]